MFEQRPGSALVPDSILRNGRTGSWIITVPNRAFLERFGTGYVPEARAVVPSAGAPRLPARTFDGVRACAALALLAGVTAIVFSLATW